MGNTLAGQYNQNGANFKVCFSIICLSYEKRGRCYCWHAHLRWDGVKYKYRYTHAEMLFI